MTASSGYRAVGIAFAVAGVLAFSFRPIWIKLIYAAPGPDGAVSPVTLLFLRMALSLPVFLAVAWWLRGRGPKLAGRDWAALAGLGFVGYYLSSFLDFIGLQYVGAGLGRLIMFLYPTMVVLLSLAFLHRHPTRRELLALAVSYAGITLVLASRLEATGFQRAQLVGVALIFGAAFTYAVYLVAGGELVKRIGSMRFTAWTMVFSTVPAVIQFAAMEPLSALELSPRALSYTLVLVVFSTVLPVFLQSEALKRIGASHFAVVGALGPVTTAIAGAVGLEEPFTAVQALGGALVIAGVLIVSLAPRKMG